MAGTIQADFLQPQSGAGLTILTPSGNTIATVNTSGIYSSTGNLLVANTGNVLITGSVTSSNVTTTDLLSTGNAAFTNTISAPNTFGFKNRLINGAMQTWQRGTSSTTTTSGWNFLSDRWAIYCAGASATWGQNTSVPTGFQYSLKMQRTAAQTYTNLLYAAQIIETRNCLDLAGQTVTFSFWAKAGANFSAASNNINVYLATGTGTDEGLAAFGGGTWTGFSAPVNQTQAITTTWTKYSYTVTLGSTVSELGVQVSFTPVGTAGADDALYITGLQVEKGSQATSFDYRPYGTELALCQRYGLGLTAASSGLGSGIWYANTAAIHQIQLPVTMRASPTLTINTAVLAAYVAGTNILSSAGAATINTNSPTSVEFYTASFSGATAGQGTSVRVNTGIIFLSAEL
jgi:hypothetical protein